MAKGKHKMKRNPYAKDLKNLEGYGKALSKRKFDPVVEPRLPKVAKPKKPKMPKKPKLSKL